MTRTIKALSTLAVFAFVATGCDQNSFDEDFPNPETEGLGPYVAFDAIGFQNNLDGKFNPAAADRGVVVPVDQEEAQTFELEARIPAALGEDVTITYTVSGDAVRGVDYTIEGTEGQLVLPFDPNAGIANTESYRGDIVVETLPAAPGEASQSLTITITGATTPSGRVITIGRIPDGRDRSVTLQFNPPAPA